MPFNYKYEFVNIREPIVLSETKYMQIFIDQDNGDYFSINNNMLVKIGNIGFTNNLKAKKQFDLTGLTHNIFKLRPNDSLARIRKVLI